MSPYDVTIIAISMIIAGISSMFIAHKLSIRWGMNKEPTFFFKIFSAGAAGLAIMYLATATAQFLGTFAAATWLVLALPFTGFAWSFLLGGIKAIEKILTGFVRKMN